MSRRYDNEGYFEAKKDAKRLNKMEKDIEKLKRLLQRARSPTGTVKTAVAPTPSDPIMLNNITDLAAIAGAALKLTGTRLDVEIAEIIALGIKVNDLDNPDADVNWVFNTKHFHITFTSPTTEAGVILELLGNTSGKDLLHLHQHTGTPAGETRLLHLEWAAANVIPVRWKSTTDFYLYFDMIAPTVNRIITYPDKDLSFAIDTPAEAEAAVEISHSEQVKAGMKIDGGGTITLDGSYRFGWSARFVVISSGKGSHFSTSGFFQIDQPTSGNITTVGGAGAATWTADGIVLGFWVALYYILPIGSVSTSIAANFRAVYFTEDLEVPDHWIFIAGRNADNNVVRVCNGLLLNAGETWVGGTSSMIKFTVAEAIAALEGNANTFSEVQTFNDSINMTGSGTDDKALKLPYLSQAPSTLENGMMWMEADGWHFYSNGGETIVPGV